MVEDVRYMQNWGEVAPALLISHQKPSSFPRLETIDEEECGSVRVPKRIHCLTSKPPWEEFEEWGTQQRNQLAKT
ncbi:hypothetical protein CRYUN_Cryun32bG0064400 [Craigia yunnanensis]